MNPWRPEEATSWRLIRSQGTKKPYNMRPLMLYKAHAIVQKRKGPHVLVWNEEGKQNWPKTKNKDTIRSPKEGGTLMCSCEVWKLGKSDSKPYTVVCKRRGPHVLIWNETKNKEHHTIAQIKRNPNVLVWSVKTREEWLKTLHDRIQESMLVYSSNKVKKKWSQAHAYMHTRPRWGPLNQIQILSQKGKKTWEFDIKGGIFRVLMKSY